MDLKGTAPRHTDLLERVSSTKKGVRLPLLHITHTGIARNIIHTGSLEARPCKFLKKELVYFFFGRPAYRLKGGSEKSNQITRAPFVFLVNPDKINPAHVYPFDTGAALAGMYTGADPTLTLHDYELNPTVEFAQKHLNWAFESVRDYLNGRLRPNLTSDAEDFDSSTLGYAEIARQATKLLNSPDHYDDRAAAIEIATAQNIDLKHFVETVILPKQYLEGRNHGKINTIILDKLIEQEIEILPYDWQPYKDPEDFRAEIDIIIEQFYEEKGWLK